MLCMIRRGYRFGPRLPSQTGAVGGRGSIVYTLAASSRSNTTRIVFRERLH